MTTALFALAAALSWGTTDFLGGRVSRSAPPLVVVWGTGAVTTVLIVIVGAVMGIPDGIGGALLWGSAGGVTVALGAIALYQGLASGRAAVVAPTAAVVGAALPVVVDLARGVTLSPLTLIGMAIGVLAIWLLTGGDAGRVGGNGLRYGVIAGLGFGSMFVFLGLAPDNTGVWPVFGSKAASVLLTSVLLSARGTRPAQLAPHRGLVLTIGALDAFATTAYLFATRAGLVSVAAVIASFYPAPTVALSAIFNGEKLRANHWVGAGLALVSLGMISA